MTRQIWWFILNAGSWLFGMGGFLYTVITFSVAETVMQQTAAAAYGTTLVLFAMFLRIHATNLRRAEERQYTLLEIISRVYSMKP